MTLRTTITTGTVIAIDRAKNGEKMFLVGLNDQYASRRSHKFLREQWSRKLPKTPLPHGQATVPVDDATVPVHQKGPYLQTSMQPTAVIALALLQYFHLPSNDLNTQFKMAELIATQAN